MGRLDGKIALCTASAQGIGLATVLAFVKEGARVIAADINISKLEQEVKDVPGIEAKMLNVADKDQVTALVDQLDRVDILFNCAGIVPNGTVLDCEEADWDQTMNINLKSMYFLCRAVLPKMVAQGSGSIVNMSSSISNVKGAPMRFVYSVSKGGVSGLTKAIAADFVSKGIRCNCICPVPSGSDFLRVCSCLLALVVLPDTARAAFVQKVGRMGKPEEIAALAVYLASDESGYTTGQELVIDGGWGLA
ncbi:putative diacetyl reductase [(R)-acetoin forming] 2 [Branchiostoma belcheri]|nr:putative diacetyl reductase [(R)-acetoin forming] 2 [Branchiostoma belcheri]